MIGFGSRHILAALAMVMMVASSGSVYARAGSGHDAWAGAPVACLPDRAQRWSDESQMQPCHCPPESYCPKNDTTIELEDISFSVSAGGTTVTVRADETTAKDAQEILKMKTNELFTLIRQPVLEKTGVDVDALYRRNGAVVLVKLYITKIDDNLKDWLNDKLKLPLMLASRCCDSVCPAGLTPTISKIEIPKPRDPNEGLRMPRTEIAAMADDLDDIKVDLQGAPGLATQIANATALKTAINNFIAALPPIIDHFKALDAALVAFDASMNEAKVPNRIKTKYADLLGRVDALELQTSQEIDILSRPVELVTVDALSCTAVRHHPREGCLIAGTKITLADGSTKPIEKLTLDDVVKGNHGPAKIIALNQFTQREEELYSINDGEAFFTVEHPVLTPKGWKSVNSKVTSFQSDAVNAGTLVVGDAILMEGGKELVVKSITKQTVPGGKAAFNLSVEGDGSFIANGFIMKGFKKVQVHY